MSLSTRILAASPLLALILFGGACGQGGGDAAPAADQLDEATSLETPAGAGTPEAAPTIVVRLEPSATPTVDPKADPFFAIEIEELTGVPVPIGAELIEFVPATDVGDARADFSMPEVEDEQIEAWFLEWMPEHGWDEGDERDGGGLVFLHTEEVSARYSSEGLKRTATVILDTLDDEIDFSLLVEAAAE